MNQRLPGNGFRQNARSNRILKFLRRAFFVVIGLVVVVDSATILADLQDPYLFASIAKALGVLVGGNACNIAIGAKVLFWLQLAVDLGIVALAISMKPTPTELKQAQSAWDFQSMKGVPKGPWMLLLVLAFAVVCYFASYFLGYTQSAQRQPCSPLTIGQAAPYWYILATYTARGIAVLTACALYFDHKATKISRAAGPLT